MLSWARIGYGAALSAVAAGVIVGAAIRPRRAGVIAAAVVVAALGPMAWNAILHVVRGREFFHDAPIAVFPVSWQDTGSGVFTLAIGSLVLNVGPLGRDPARRAIAVALLAAVAAFLVDIYLY